MAIDPFGYYRAPEVRPAYQQPYGLLSRAQLGGMSGGGAAGHGGGLLGSMSPQQAQSLLSSPMGGQLLQSLLKDGASGQSLEGNPFAAGNSAYGNPFGGFGDWLQGLFGSGVPAATTSAGGWGSATAADAAAGFFE